MLLSEMRHNPLEQIAAHEIIPRWVDGMPAWCEVCDATLSDAEVDAINRDREVHAANLRLLEGGGPAEREVEDENGRLE